MTRGAGRRSSLLFGCVVSGQIKLRRIDGWRKITAMLKQLATVAA